MEKNDMKNMGAIGDMLGGIKAEYTPTAGNATKKKFDTLKDDSVSNKEVKGVVVRSGGIVDALCIIYEDGSGTVQGNLKGGSEHKIMLDNGDSIKSISGVSGSDYHGERAISKLVIETVNGKKYGPFGSRGGKSFTISIPEGGVFAGFVGTASIDDRRGFVESLGMSYMKADEDAVKGLMGGLQNLG
ncbi:MAG: hypothetical protein NC092_08495 [Butyrivibrio sp.]|nr:hypothetical protein [Muribaculum sp.]MCM1552715.1 hypothetical protein [Butyrivibrio sp.]